MKLENLHVDTAGAKAELEHSADSAFPLRVVRPPAAKTFARGQCLVGIIQGRRFDSNSVQDIHHIPFLLLVLATHAHARNVAPLFTRPFTNRRNA
jgi:hypothetical protein